MAQEILTFDEQVWLAKHWGFADQPHLLAVEQFMQQYYRHTMGLHVALMRFVERCRRRSLWQRIVRWLPSPRIDQYFAVDGEALTVRLELRSQVLGQPSLLLTLFNLARSRKLSIDPSLEDIHRHAETLTVEQFHTPETGKTFLSILADPGTAKTLEAMHRAHLLEKLVPAFSRVRGLMQFNQYHKYTVDEHSLPGRGESGALTDHVGVLGEVYREIKRKDLLHLALLLHDLGRAMKKTIVRSESGWRRKRRRRAWGSMSGNRER